MNDALSWIAIQAALRAGDILRQGYGTKIDITFKPGAYNLVTQFDHAAEKAIIQFIRDKFPDHAFLAEESGASACEEAPVLWVIDPLDGTTNFAHNIPLFAVSIGALVKGVVQVGVIYIPMTNELFVAVRGEGAYMNGIHLQVSQTKDFTKSVGATGFPHDIGENTSYYMDRLVSIAQKCRPIRDLGSAAINLAYLAAGRVDFYWIDSLQPWDVAAGKLLVEEAGGKVTHYNGTPHNLDHDSSLLASNGSLHSELLNILKHK